MDVRVYNTNTNRIIIETVELDEYGEYREDGNYLMAGVSSPGSEVKCAFVKPAGSMTGKLFPTGHQQETISVLPPVCSPSPDPEELIDVRVTMIDGANPFVLIDSASISTLLKTLPSASATHELIESIRREAAVTIGLAPSVEAASKTRGTPKAAIIYPPLVSSDPKSPTPDIRVQAYSMGLPHPSLQLTGAVTIATALCAPGTVAADLAAKGVAHHEAPPTPERSPERPPEGSLKEQKTGHKISAGDRHVVIAHSQGTIDVDVTLGRDGQVSSCSVSRTARRLFEGRVRYYIAPEEA